MGIAHESAHDSYKTRSPHDQAAAIRFAALLEASERRLAEALNAATKNPIRGKLRIEASGVYADDEAHPHGGMVELSIRGIECCGDEELEVAEALEELARRLRRRSRRRTGP